MSSVILTTASINSHIKQYWSSIQAVYSVPHALLVLLMSMVFLLFFKSVLLALRLCDKTSNMIQVVNSCVGAELHEDDGVWVKGMHAVNFVFIWGKHSWHIFSPVSNMLHTYVPRWSILGWRCSLYRESEGETDSITVWCCSELCGCAWWELVPSNLCLSCEEVIGSDDQTRWLDWWSVILPGWRERLLTISIMVVWSRRDCLYVTTIKLEHCWVQYLTRSKQYFSS